MSQKRSKRQRKWAKWVKESKGMGNLYAQLREDGGVPGRPLPRTYDAFVVRFCAEPTSRRPRFFRRAFGMPPHMNPRDRARDPRSKRRG